MPLPLGTVRPGSTLRIPFHTFDSNDPSASVTVSGLAVTDIEVYKDGSATQRASDNGYTLLDTDGIDFDTITGIHGFSIDLADNSDAGFYEAGSDYWVVVSAITVDAATVNFIAATFTIGYAGALLDTTIATLASQTSFTLEDGSADDDAYNGREVWVHDVASGVQVCVGEVSDYTGSTKTVTLAADPGIFTMAAGDNVSMMGPAMRGTDSALLASSAPTNFGDLSITASTGRVHVDSIAGTTQSAGDISGNLGLAADAARTGDPSAGDSVVQYVKQLVNILVGTAGVATFPAAASPANAVSLAESIRDIHDTIDALNNISVSDVLTTQMTESYNADGTAPTLAQGIFLLISFLMERSTSGTTQTIKKLDGSTTAATFTLDSATSPTSVTRAT